MARQAESIRSATGGPKGPVFNPENVPKVTFEELEPLFTRPVHAAAAEYGVGTSKFKQMALRVGIKKWPYRAHKRLVMKQEVLEKRIKFLQRDTIDKRSPFTRMLASLSEPERSIRRKTILNQHLAELREIMALHENLGRDEEHFDDPRKRKREDLNVSLGDLAEEAKVTRTDANVRQGDAVVGGLVGYGNYDGEGEGDGEGDREPKRQRLPSFQSIFSGLIN